MYMYIASMMELILALRTPYCSLLLWYITVTLILTTAKSPAQRKNYKCVTKKTCYHAFWH